MIDTHAHLYFKDYDQDLKQVLDNAKANGIEYIINPAIDLETSQKAAALSQKYDSIYAAVGAHPNHADSLTEDVVLEMEKLLKQEKVVAIGEVGLDYYREGSLKQVQRKWFSRFVNMAFEYKMPLIVHNRDAHGETLDILDSEDLSDQPGVFHCFSGQQDFAKKVLDLGFYIGLAGPITFPNARDLREVVNYIPLDRIVIETDAPFLAPQAHRGKRNEPAYVKFVAEKLAELKGVSLEEVDRVTTRNAKNLFFGKQG